MSPSATDFAAVQLPVSKQQRTINVVVVSSVALAFISFWRAAAIVLCDLASSAYYVGGISEQAVGKAAPWFILAVMLFSYAVRAVYVESCSMFTRGGVYRVVREAMGGTLAKLSVSALMFDYILTGPISAVAAAQYILGLFGELLAMITRGPHPIVFNSQTYPQQMAVLTMAISIGITLYFWRANTLGMHESSDKALRIMQATTIMGIVIIVWSVLTIFLRKNVQMPPIHPVFTAESEGWLAGMPKIVGFLGVSIAFGHSLLAMSGEESLAQVNREIEAPKLKNLLRAGFVIFLYSLLLTGLVSLLAVLIIPDGKRVATFVVPNGQAHTETTLQVDYLRPGEHAGESWGYELANPSAEFPKVTDKKVLVTRGWHVERDDGGYRDNLINGLSHYLAGPSWLKIGMQMFVVVVGFLILAGAVNTSMVGSNGVLNRLAEDGVLTPWFLTPHRKFGTTYRLINLITVLQLATIVFSWGDVNTLGEAYAFGVIWSFVFATLAMCVLRFKDRTPRQYEVPLNIRIHPKQKADGTKSAEIDLPIGILLVFLVLFSTACVNLLTKKTATIWGIGFTAAFLAVFVIMEQITTRRRRGEQHKHMEQFNETNTETVSATALGLTHPKPVIVAVRNPGSLKMLNKVLSDTNTDEQDVVVITCKVLPPMTQGVTPQERSIQEVDRNVLTSVVTVAEKAGKQIFPLVVPTNNPLYAIASAARDLNATQVILGDSEKMSSDMLAEQFALAWGSAMADSTSEWSLTLRVLGDQKEARFDL
jgi:amino acid transporter